MPKILNVIYYYLTMAKTILLIEDDPDIQKMYSDKLSFEGFEVLTSTDGKKGLLLAKTEKPDLVLLDIMLPQGMNGFDVLEEIKKDEDIKDLPVIVLTNLDTEKQVAEKVGASDYLVKANTQLNDLITKIKTYI